ncbi:MULTISPECIES: hypothetical protein [Streptomyces]|jgi:hypothetical protein|uniref:hypothetical protein n=1 Tax=Streptomyces TaxID=1883 RepID=UPI0016756429|nr:hypothetical protein [Streptomyces pseudogriseolus]MCI3154170.1 hypothetical protein [Streptomyces sp. GB4-14]MCP9997675.1 hypothetical protein [Streptomyces werraensis]GHE82185.1 hypothetical protein GCM10018789_07280 [Streptomyces werraensis]
MKSLKAAAVLAGSLIAAGVAAPAYADTTDLASTGLDTGLRTAVPFELMPLHESDTLEADQESVMGTAKEAAGVVNEVKPVRGDVGLHA